MPELLLAGAMALVELLAVSTERLNPRPLLMRSSSVNSGSDAAARKGPVAMQAGTEARAFARATAPTGAAHEWRTLCSKWLFASLKQQVRLEVVELVCLAGDVMNEGLADGHELG